MNLIKGGQGRDKTDIVVETSMFCVAVLIFIAVIVAAGLV